MQTHSASALGGAASSAYVVRSAVVPSLAPRDIASSVVIAPIDPPSTVVRLSGSFAGAVASAAPPSPELSQRENSTPAAVSALPPSVNAAVDDGEASRDPASVSSGSSVRGEPVVDEAGTASESDESGQIAGREQEKSAPADETEADRTPASTSGSTSGFNAEELELLDKLQSRDREVRTHEAAHQAAGGQHAGAASFTFERGPDGVSYAVGGEVPIDIAPVANNPAATIQKMRTVRSAALAPNEPSSQDRRVAAVAMQSLLQAQAELASKNAAERKASASGGSDETGESGAGDRSLGARDSVLAYRQVADMHTAADFQKAPLISDYA